MSQKILRGSEEENERAREHTGNTLVSHWELQPMLLGKISSETNPKKKDVKSEN